MPVPDHPLEAVRLARVRASGVLDTPRELRFERLVFMAAQIAKVPIAKINLIDADRMWSKAYVGTSSRQMSRDVALCSFAILGEEMLIIEDARADAQFFANPLVTGPPFIRFYAGFPLYSDDRLPVGTLCVIDRERRRLTDDQLNGLILVAREAEDLLFPQEQDAQV
jgi:GAF domain-containing protein